MYGSTTVRRTIGTHWRRRINLSVIEHDYWPMIWVVAVIRKFTSTCYQLFSIEKCLLSVAKAPAMQLSSSFPNRANKAHLSLTPLNWTEHELLKHIVGRECSWCCHNPWDCWKLHNLTTNSLIISEIKLENVWGGYEKKDHVWGRHKKQDLFRVQWCGGNHRSAFLFFVHLAFIQNSFRTSEDFRRHQLWFGWEIQFHQGRYLTFPSLSVNISINSTPRSWSLVSWAARWQVCYAKQTYNFLVFIIW